MVQRIWLSDAPNRVPSIEKVAEIAPAQDISITPVQIRYMNPETLAEPHLRGLFEHKLTTREPAVEVHRVKDAMVLASGLVVTMDGYVLNDTFGPYARSQDINAEFDKPEENTSAKVLTDGDVRISFRQIEKRRGPCFNLRDHGEFGYFHFMNTVMPSAMVWKDRFAEVPCYYATGSDFQTGYFDMLGVSRDPQNHVGDGSTMFFDDLLVVAGLVRPDGHTGGFFERPRFAVDAMRQLAAGSAKGTRRRVYISRRDAAARQMSNEAELENLLETAFGFAPVQTTGLTPAQQIELFKGCDAVIGLHGAGLSNMVFCAPETHIIELFPPTRIWPTFRALAYRCGHRYSAIVLESDQAVDLRRMRELLSELI